MAPVSLTTYKSVEGDAPYNAATAYACGWRIDADLRWVRPLKAGDPKEPLRNVHVRDRHVFAACACAALAFDRGDLAYVCEAHA
jgi:hypothetical protein